MVMRDIALVRLTGARMHFLHLSTAGSVAMVRAAKAAGLPITAEAAPHHFTLTDECCAGYDPIFKVHPPLRTDMDVEAVKEGLADGTIDAIATDHAPHSSESKELPFAQAPPGMLGLEYAFALANTELGLGLAQVLKLLGDNPAQIAGISVTTAARSQRAGPPTWWCSIPISCGRSTRPAGPRSRAMFPTSADRCGARCCTRSAMASRWWATVCYSKHPVRNRATCDPIVARS
jgi:hypothetical protein